MSTIEERAEAVAEAYLSVARARNERASIKFSLEVYERDALAGIPDYKALGSNETERKIRADAWLDDSVDVVGARNELLLATEVLVLAEAELEGAIALFSAAKYAIKQDLIDVLRSRAIVSEHPEARAEAAFDDVAEELSEGEAGHVLDRLYGLWGPPPPPPPHEHEYSYPTPPFSEEQP